MCLLKEYELLTKFDRFATNEYEFCQWYTLFVFKHYLYLNVKNIETDIPSIYLDDNSIGHD